MFPLVAPKNLSPSGLSMHRPNGSPVRLLGTAEVFERMTAATPIAKTAADAIVVPAVTAVVPTVTSAVPVATPVAPAVTSEDARPFRKGDLVVYPAHGIGTVDQVRVEEIGGQKLNWIKISFAENRMSLRIPVRKAKEIGLRRPVTRQAFAEVLTIVRGRPHANRIVWTKRALEYQGKINSGSVKALAEVVRDLRPSVDGSESSFSRRNLFESAIDRLAAEFAAVFRTDKAAAVGRLMGSSPAG
jgi:CarD family transcriptional regulator